jgi:hypothetical protein
MANGALAWFHPIMGDAAAAPGDGSSGVSVRVSPGRFGVAVRFAAAIWRRQARLVFTAALFLAGLTLALHALGMLGSGRP